MNVAVLSEENASLKALLAQTQAALAESEEARRRLEGILGDLQREKFGAKSEKLSPDQFNLPLEDVELAQGMLDAAQEKAEAALRGKRNGEARPRNRNRGNLPAHLPRVERVIEPDSTARAPAAVARWRRSARTFPSGSMWFPRSSACW
jgi:hypothetical protein